MASTEGDLTPHAEQLRSGGGDGPPVVPSVVQHTVKKGEEGRRSSSRPREIWRTQRGQVRSRGPCGPDLVGGDIREVGAVDDLEGLEPGAAGGFRPDLTARKPPSVLSRPLLQKSLMNLTYSRSLSMPLSPSFSLTASSTAGPTLSLTASSTAAPTRSVHFVREGSHPYRMA